MMNKSAVVFFLPFNTIHRSTGARRKEREESRPYLPSLRDIREPSLWRNVFFRFILAAEHAASELFSWVSTHIAACQRTYQRPTYRIIYDQINAVPVCHHR